MLRATHTTPASFRARVIVLSALLLTGCVPIQPTHQPTQLEIRQLQTRTYDNDKGRFKRVMKALINVLQDDGFIIRNADKELGFITASKEIDLGGDWDFVFNGFGDGNTRYRKNAIMEASINISEFGREIKVRAIFQRKVMDNLGGVMSVRQIKDGSYYQDFFAKVDKGIFLERQDL